MAKNQKIPPITPAFRWFAAIVSVVFIVCGAVSIIKGYFDSWYFENTAEALATAANAKHYLLVGLISLLIGIIGAWLTYRAPSRKR